MVKSLRCKSCWNFFKNNEKYNHFNLVKNKINVKSYFFDICKKKLENVVIKEKPDYIFHLAAQSIVYKSILNPRFNWETNVMGLFNLLEAINKMKKKMLCSYYN